MIIYLSGGGGYTVSNPEVLIADKACLMLTYYNYHADGPDRRFTTVLDSRKAGKATKPKPTKQKAKKQK